MHSEKDRILIRACAKEPSDRKSDENKLLTDYFSAVKCLKELKINNQEWIKVISAISLMYVSRNEVLFRYGDRGTNFYVCLSGSCQLYIPNPEREVLKN